VRQIPHQALRNLRGIAELVAYFCGDAARYVTGANWEIDGDIAPSSKGMTIQGRLAADA
jgi:hypothetical protein